MTIRWFELFDSVAKHGSITKAARELHVSQPSVSRQLKLLQEEFQIRAFERISRTIELTHQGRAFRRDIKSILSRMEALKKKYAGEAYEKKSDPVHLPKPRPVTATNNVAHNGTSGTRTRR